MARKHKITLTTEDHKHLEVLFVSSFAEAFSDKAYLNDLRGKLDAAQVVSRDEVPGDVITMNSTVRLKDLTRRTAETFTLVYPYDANIAAGKLSILAPLGTAILGYRVGDTIHWNSSSQAAQWHVEEVVFQPEREDAAA